MKGKLIVIEGTDCSGKETQTNLLLQHLNDENIRVEKFSFPNYQSPTGKIVGGPYLGKDYICEGWFSEGATKVDPKVASLYYAADRKYNIHKITWLLENGVNVILDRYVYSNMAHQGGKISDLEKREEMYNWLEHLEFNLLELPKADIKIFLHMPYDQAVILKKSRLEKPDQHEFDIEHLQAAENAYIELANKYQFTTVECTNGNDIRSIENIQEELYEIVLNQIKNQN
ncbi:MAG: thymidylate kinase [Firmicutes bacterium]|nr:thymidylate kinase [Bacillota bacterium]